MKSKQIVIAAAALCLCICIAGCKRNMDEQTTGKDIKVTEKASEVSSENVVETSLEDAVETDTIDATDTAVAAEVTDGWQVVNNTSFEHKANKIAFYNKDYGITVGYSGEIHYTGDQGKTWPQAQNKTLCLFGIDIIDENFAFACGNGKNVTKTSDGGKTWNRVTDFGGTSPNQCQLLSFVDENTGLIASQNQLAYTSDSGNTWTELTAPVKIMAIHLTNTTKGYLIGTDRKLYITEDAGATWVAQELDIKGFENGLTAISSCAFSISEDGSGILFYLDRDGVLNCFETKDSSAAWTKTAELKDTLENDKPCFLYLSRDAKYLTLQGIECKSGAVVSKVK